VGSENVYKRQVLGGAVVFFCLAWWGYDPQRGWIKQRGAA